MRSKVNLTLDTEVSAEARQLGLNMSRLAEEAIASAVKEERNRLWREQNKGRGVTFGGGFAFDHV